MWGGETPPRLVQRPQPGKKTRAEGAGKGGGERSEGATMRGVREISEKLNGSKKRGEITPRQRLGGGDHKVKMRPIGTKARLKEKKIS